MRNYQSKQNQGAVPDSISAERFGAGEFNSIAVELENAVLSSDQTLAPADGTGEISDQLAMALSIYGAGGASYMVDTGAVNAYILNPAGSKEAPPTYFDGFYIVFEPGNDNTGASTVNVNSLGVKSITLPDGTALSGGELTGTCFMKFNSANDRFELLYTTDDIANLQQLLEDRLLVAENNAALDRIRTLQAGEYPIRNTVNGFVDAYQDNSSIDTSLSGNENYDSSRTAWVPTRSQAATIYSTDFDNLTGWTDISSGTGGAAIVPYTGDPDPAIGSNGVELTSGGTIGGIGAIEQDVGTIPDGKFGIMYIATLEQVGGAGSDALEITLETDAGKMLQVRHRDNAMEVYADGAWQFIFAGGGNFSTEWWVNAFNVGGGDHKIDVYAGTENVGTYTGALPAGTTDGMLTFKQNSGSANNRISQVWINQVGITQIPENLTLVSNEVEAAFEPTKCRLCLFVEDVSNVITVIPANFTADVSLDDGGTWETVTLINQGEMQKGEIDSTKPTYLFTAEHSFTSNGDQTMRYRINVLGNQWIAIQGADMQWQ